MDIYRQTFFFLFAHLTTSHLRIASVPHHDLRSNKSPICTSHVIISTTFNTSLTLLSPPLLFHSSIGYGATIMIFVMLHAIGHSDTHRVFPSSGSLKGSHTVHSFWFSCIYIGSTVNGELHGVRRMTTSLGTVYVQKSASAQTARLWRLWELGYVAIIVTINCHFFCLVFIPTERIDSQTVLEDHHRF